MLLCLVKHSYSSAQPFLVMECWELWTAPAPLMWTSAGSWVGSCGPTPRAGYKLIGTTIPVLNMAIYSCKNIKYFIVKKSPRNLLRALAEKLTHQIHSFLQVSTGWSCHFLLFICPFICLFMALFLDFWIHKSWAKFNRKYREFPYTPSPATSSLSHH